MKSHFRLRVAIVMIVLAIFISYTIATFDHLRYRDLIIENHQREVQKIEETVINSLNTIDKAYYIFDEETTEKMEQNTHYLLNLYKDTPNFDDWDLNGLKNLLGMDIYIINDKNIVSHSSFEKDIGLDFYACCGKLARTLDERRVSGEFYTDGMDIEQETGEIKKYSYMATHDQKYLIQLGYSLQSGPVFKGFNFLDTIEDLVEKHVSINEINVLNIGGLAVGKPNAKLSKERRKAFEQTLSTRKVTELETEWNNEPATYRYVHYYSDYDMGTTKDRIVEIVYSEHELAAVLSKSIKTFVTELFIVLLLITLVAFIIHRWVAKQVYYANHDSLTGLKNRNAFDELLHTYLSEKKETVALFMIDLDNFKLVNDYLGHDKGDYVLQIVAQSICSTVQRETGSLNTFRLGGDEFSILFQSTSKQQAKNIAEKLIHSINETIKKEGELRELHVTASVGIAINDEQEIDQRSLFKRADIALYVSKEKGKNQFHIYTDEMKEGNIA